MILVDDHLLAARFGDVGFGPLTSPLATTCSWWWRLASVVHRQGLDPLGVDVLADVVLVPDRRLLLPAMSRAAAAFRLSVEAAEALVAAEALPADIVVGRPTPRLREAARVRGVTYLVEA